MTRSYIRSTAAAWRITLGLAAGIVLLPQGVQAAFAEKSVLSGRLNIALGLEAMTGETNCAIGGNYVSEDGQKGSIHFPLSKLEWPLDIWLARLDAGWNLNPAWRLNGTLKTNLSDPDGRMTDKDWLSAAGQLDVYSESGVTSLDAFILDVDLEHTFWQKGLWTFYAGAGYRHQNFQYDSSLIYQYSPSGLAGYFYEGDGKTNITYEVTYSMPYLLLGSEFQLTPELRLSGSVAVSPLTGAEDEDHHPLRDIVSVGDMDGAAYLLDLSGIYYVTPRYFVEAGVQHTGVETDGEQNQVENGQAAGQIEMEAESSQTSGYLNVGYSF